MKLAFFLADYPVTSETFILRQISGLVRRGHDVTVIAGYVNDRVPDPLHGQISVRRIRKSLSTPDHLKRIGLGVLKATMAPGRQKLNVARRAILAKVFGVASDIYFLGDNHLGHYDAVVAHFGPAGVRAMLLRDAGLLSGSIATVFHGIDMTDRGTLSKYKKLYEDLFSRTELVLPISQLWCRKLLEWGAPKSKVQVLRMGVDIDEGSAHNVDRPIQKPLRILSVGRFVEKKGLEYAITGVSRSGVKSIYTIVGYGPLEDRLKSLAVDAENAQIVFAGKVGHNKIFELLSQSDVFLLPSVTAENGDMEGIPVSIMEAMAAGVLVIATQHSGIPELVEHNVEGLLVEERSSDEIAKVLRDVYEGHVDACSLKLEARRKVDSEFNNILLDRDLESLLAKISHL